MTRLVNRYGVPRFYLVRFTDNVPPVRKRRYCAPDVLQFCVVVAAHYHLVVFENVEVYSVQNCTN